MEGVKGILTALVWGDPELYKYGSNLWTSGVLGIAAAGGVSSCAVFASVNCSGTISDSGFLVAIILQTLWLESCYQWAVCDTASASAQCLQFSFTRFVTGHQSHTVSLLLPRCFKLGSN